MAAAGLASFVLVPLLALALAGDGSSVGLALLSAPALAALRVSLLSASISTLVIVACGTPLAWWLAQSRRRSARVLSVVLRAPLAMPPAAAGIALILAFGRRGWIGQHLDNAGFSLSFTLAAVVLAQTFVAAPFYLQGAKSAFERLPKATIEAAQVMMQSESRSLWRVAVPAVRLQLVGAATLSWGRALGEFGATLLFAGSLAGVTRTLPLAIYAAFEDDMAVARALSLWLVLVAMITMAAAGFATRVRTDDD